MAISGRRAQDGPLLPRDPDPVAEHYGAVNFCAERGQEVRSGCRLAAGDGNGGTGTGAFPYNP